MCAMNSPSSSAGLPAMVRQPYCIVGSASNILHREYHLKHRKTCMQLIEQPAYWNVADR
jgi:hypothetical protein